MVGFFMLQSWLIVAWVFKTNTVTVSSFIQLRNTLTAKNSTSVVDKLILSAKRVLRSLQQAFYFAVRAVSSRRVIAGAVVVKTVLSRYLPNPLTYSEALVQKAGKMFVSRLNSISVDSLKLKIGPYVKFNQYFLPKSM